MKQCRPFLNALSTNKFVIYGHLSENVDWLKFSTSNSCKKKIDKR